MLPRARVSSIGELALDPLGNLYKDKLSRLLPAFAERACAVVSPRIALDEAKSYSDDDARSWALLQRLRHADRWWQTKVSRSRIGRNLDYGCPLAGLASSTRAPAPPRTAAVAVQCNSS